jgi:hypothetical protein
MPKSEFTREACLLVWLLNELKSTNDREFETYTSNTKIPTILLTFFPNPPFPQTLIENLTKI